MVFLLETKIERGMMASQSLNVSISASLRVVTQHMHMQVLVPENGIVHVLQSMRALQLPCHALMTDEYCCSVDFTKFVLFMDRL